jgi:lysozyme
MSNYRTSGNGVMFIASFEKLRLEAYLPTKNDRWTIGYGTTYYEDGSPVKEGDIITKEQANNLFTLGLRNSERVANRLTLPTQNMFDAIVSFIYNLGEGSWNTSTLRKIVVSNPTNYMAIETEFNRWIYQHKIKLDGLKERRAKEFKIYMEGIYINH